MSSEQNEEINAPEEETKAPQTPSSVILREFPKTIFFYPLFFTSLVLWLLQTIVGIEPVAIFGFIWVVVFFINLFVTAFDFGSKQFFIFMLVIIVAVLLIWFLVLPQIELSEIARPQDLNIGMTPQFYGVMTFILGIILLFVIIKTRFDYWKIERNEIFHKKGIFSQDERYPIQQLSIRKEIPDVFEYFILKAGSITLKPGDESFHLSTVPNVSDKADEIDRMLSHLEVEVDQLD